MNFILSKIHWLKSKVFRSAEQEVIEFHEQLSDLSMQNQSLAAAKRKLEQEADNLKQDAEDMRGTLNISKEEKKEEIFKSGVKIKKIVCFK